MPRSFESRAWVWFFVVLLSTAISLAFIDGIAGVFVFDDAAAIQDNPSIQDGSGWAPMHPPSHRTVSGRPVLNLSLAINYRLGGTAPRGYHVFNITIHAVAALLLFGVMRRTLAGRALGDRFGAVATPLAFVIALLWAVHPLQTESVTYVIQRAESLVGLFYLLTLHCFIRAATGARGGWWLAASVGACLLGMGTKEVMVSAPLFVLVYDRTLVAGSFRRAWQARRLYYLALAATWGWLLFLVVNTHGRDGSAGIGAGMGAWEYALTQCRAVVHYLHLCFWPRPLILDYGTEVVRSALTVLPQALLLLALFGLTLWALYRRWALGLAGLWFFAILAPSSSVVPVITQTMAEHRMYLPLAAVVVVIAATAYRWGGRYAMWGAGLLAFPLALVTVNRNLAYGDAETLWRDTIADCPTNPRLYDALGNFLADRDRLVEAETEFHRGLQIDPAYAESHNNLGVVLHKRKQFEAALAEFRQAIALKPEYAAAHYNLANTLMDLGRKQEAVREYRETNRIKPGDPVVLERLANVELENGDREPAERHFREVLTANPHAMAARFNLAFLLLSRSQWAEARSLLEEGIGLEPNSAPAHYNLGNLHVQLGEMDAAIREYERSIELDPNLAPAHYNLGNSLALQGDFASAARQFEVVLQIDPLYPGAREKCTAARMQAITQRGALH